MNALPGLLLILLFSCLIGFGFHLWKGGSIFRMLFFVLFSLLGFGIGQWIGSSLKSTFLLIGWVQAGFGNILAMIFAYLAVWLSKLNLEDVK